MNKQREVIYAQRKEVLGGENLKEEILAMADGLAQATCKSCADSHLPAAEWDFKGLSESLFHQFNFRFQLNPDELEDLTPEDLEEKALDQVSKCYEAKEQNISPDLLRQLEKIIMLQTIDSLWKRSPPSHGPYEGGYRTEGLRTEKSVARVSKGSIWDV